MSVILIDDQGELWRGDSRQLREAFDSPFSGGEFVEYAIKNLGFIALNMYGTSCQLRLRPGFATAKAIMSVRDWLRSTKVARIVLTTFEGDWRDELLQPAKIEGRLEGMAESTVSQRPDDLLRAPLTAAALEARSEVMDIIDGWPHLLTTYEAATLTRLLRTVFGDRFVVVRKADGADRFVFQEIGPTMFPGYDPWRTCAIGAPLEEQPDRNYGRWVAKVYREAIETGEPRVEAVDAIMRCPVKGRSRFRYKRLIFPLPQSSTGPLLVGGSFTDTSIDLRIPRR
jgi:hypothetical protein